MVVASGASYVVFGKEDGGIIELSDIDDGNTNEGFVINGRMGVTEAVGRSAGRAMSTAMG